MGPLEVIIIVVFCAVPLAIGVLIYVVVKTKDSKEQ